MWRVSLEDNGWDKFYLPIIQRFVENLVLHCIRFVASFQIVEDHFDVLEIQTECDKLSLRYQQWLGCVLCGNVCVLKNKILGDRFGVDKLSIAPTAARSLFQLPIFSVHSASVGHCTNVWNFSHITGMNQLSSSCTVVTLISNNKDRRL